MKFNLADGKMNVIPSPEDAGKSVIHSGADWVAGKVGEGVSSAGDAIGQAIVQGLTTGWHSMPMILTIAGLLCFLITMALGNGRLYGWGCASWAAAAIIKVMNNG